MWIKENEEPVVVVNQRYNKTFARVAGAQVTYFMSMLLFINYCSVLMSYFTVIGYNYVYEAWRSIKFMLNETHHAL